MRSFSFVILALTAFALAPRTANAEGDTPTSPIAEDPTSTPASAEEQETPTTAAEQAATPASAEAPPPTPAIATTKGPPQGLYLAMGVSVGGDVTERLGMLFAMGKQLGDSPLHVRGGVNFGRAYDDELPGSFFQLRAGTESRWCKGVCWLIGVDLAYTHDWFEETDEGPVYRINTFTAIPRFGLEVRTDAHGVPFGLRFMGEVPLSRSLGNRGSDVGGGVFAGFVL